MKRAVGFIILLAVVLLAAAACAETLGFGFVNDRDVALRREPGGKIVVRLPRDTCVWIKDSRTDKKGTLWYQVNAGINQNHTNYDCTGWMKAEFIDAGEDIWHDITVFSASNQGMIAVRSDGTAEVAGRLLIDSESGEWVEPRGSATAALPIEQAAAYWGNSYAFVTSDGLTHGVDTDDSAFTADRLRLFCGYDFLFGIDRNGKLVSLIRGQASQMSWIWPESDPGSGKLNNVAQIASNDCRVLMRTEDGELYAAGWTRDTSNEPEPDWGTWTDLVSIDAATGYFVKDEINQMTAAGVRSDGTVLAHPSVLAKAIGGWTEMQDVKLSRHGAVGLKKDGTAVSAGWNGYEAIDVSGWTDIIAVDTADDYCVGLKSDGTLVFAGEHIFMRDGHSKK